MNERDSIQKQIMIMASEMAVINHLDCVVFDLKPSEFGDGMFVTFDKGGYRTKNIFLFEELFSLRNEVRAKAIFLYLESMIEKIKEAFGDE